MKNVAKLIIGVVVFVGLC